MSNTQLEAFEAWCKKQGDQYKLSMIEQFGCFTGKAGGLWDTILAEIHRYRKEESNER